MKIIALQAENIKKLVAIEIKPDGHLVEITGKNGQGKTSVLDAIWWALSGSANIQGAPIRNGATEARIRLDLGEIIVKRTFKAKEGGEYTSSLVVESKDGARFPGPQAMLDKLLGVLSFDPLAFARADAKGQVETLRRLAPGVNFDAIDGANKADYAKRTDLSRRAKEAAGAASAIPLIESLPARVDERALIHKMEMAANTNAQLERERAARTEAQRAINDARNQASRSVDKAREDVQVAQELLAESEAKAADVTAKTDREQALLDARPALGEPVDVSDISAQIEAAKATNAAVDADEKRGEYLKTAEDLDAQVKALTKAMEDREAQKRAAIEAAKLPVPGLSFGEAGVILAGVPFNQASDAEQLRASVAIAMALNPKLRVLRVRDGSLLDEDALKLIADMAKDNDFQVWLEKVDGSGKVGFVLEDGHVRAAAEPAAAA